MRVSSINHADASKMKRSEALELLGSAGDSLEVDVEYDPKGYEVDCVTFFFLFLFLFSPFLFLKIYIYLFIFTYV